EDVRAASHALHFEHQAEEVLLDQAYLPGVIRGLEVFQVVVAVDVDQVEFTVLAGVALLAEPLVQHQVVALDAFRGLAARALAPDDERAAAVRRGAGDGAEPPWAVR